MSTSSGNGNLDPCGCCPQGMHDPQRHNRPGLPAMSYRLGTHSRFVRRMLARLHTQTVSNGSHPLEGLSGRSASDDPAIALLDAAAVVADVLTFYQERIANEGFLGTATERRSILEIARSIGYELNPGVAASTYLAFSVADAPTMPKSETVPLGTQVQSIPPQGKLPQTFETTDEFTAYLALNALAPRLSQPQAIGIETTQLYLEGVATNLQVGDAILVVGEEREISAQSERWDLRFVTSVTPNAEVNNTLVMLDAALGHESPQILPATNPRVYAFRQRASLFGYNAPDWRVLPPNVRQGFDTDVDPDDSSTWGTEWPDFEILTLNPPRIHLDTAYPKIMVGSWVALSRPSYVELYRADEVVTESRTNFTLTAKCTRITLDTGDRQRGVQTVTATDGAVSAWAPYTITLAPTPDVAVSPASGIPGSTITIAGTGFTPAVAVTITMGGVALATATTGRQGRFSTTATVPNLSQGIQTVTATDGAVSASAPYTITLAPTPDVAVSPASGISGSTITIAGTGFTPAVAVTITMGGVALATATTDSQGRFSTTATVPNLLSWFGLRDTVVFAQSEELRLAERPITEPIYGDKIVLDSLVENLEEDKPLIFSGKPPGLAEVADLSRIVRTGTTEESRPGETLVLAADDGSQRTLSPGDLLEAQGQPTSQTGGLLLWRFRTSNGFEGVIALEPESDALVWREASKDADAISEVVFIETVSDDGERTNVALAASLQNLYDRASLSISGNVVGATHGETVKEEILGSGDGAQANQRFKLKKRPVTYVSASTPSGAEGTLEVRVNGILWEEVPSLYGLSPHSQSYVVRMDNDTTAWVIFGDGVSGSRLPTGSENVKATYRSGIGLDGEVDANSLSLLKRRLQGIQSVNNPVAAGGSADPEVLDDARTNAPLTVLTLDRLVSLTDFEEHARAFAGIGKAQATDIWRGETHLVHLTVASASGSPIEASSDLYVNLVASMEGSYDPRHTFVVADYEPLQFSVSAKVLIDSRYVAEDVLAAVRSALETKFSFQERSLGQSVAAAGIITVIHSVEGVIAVDLDALYLPDESPVEQVTATTILAAERGRLDPDTKEMLPAQLIVLNPEGVTLSQMEEAR